MIEVARQAARANGFADRIELFEESSLDVELPELADVAVADLRGILPLHTANLAALEDARRRLLKPGGVLIPQRDVLRGALAEAPRETDEHLDVWRKHGRGFDLEAARDSVANSFWKTRTGPETLLSSPAVLATLDYAAGTAGDVSAAVALKTTRAGSLNGLVVWFDTALVEDIGFSNAPGAPEALYGRAFFPLPEVVPVSEGEAVRVDFGASFAAGDFVYRWAVRVGAKGEQPRVQFRQSTFAGMPLSGRALEAVDESRAPALGPRGRLARRALELMDGERTLSEIASELEQEAGSHEDAVALVSSLAWKYEE